MKHFFIFSLALLLFVSICPDALSGNKTVAQGETSLLASELTLAKKPIIYFIFNLQEKTVLLKSRGLILREMKIDDMEFWGDPVDAKPRVVVKKSTLFEPKRINIDPDKNKEEETDTSNTPNPTPGAFNIDALELQDMPTSYRVEFRDGISLSVRSKKEGFVPGVVRAANYLGWYVSRPILTIWNSIKGRPFTSIYVTMSVEDARSIYWSLVEKSENIIYQP
ncbi:MAG: hypothetical protein C4538_07460 [Nitrospiraceae bacterium]|nr:MAG: hypothetical protein C4538_07460 [Nitrospiraceae bacterium]